MHDDSGETPLWSQGMQPVMRLTEDRKHSDWLTEGISRACKLQPGAMPLSASTASVANDHQHWLTVSISETA
jgi:hypothetical protein